MSSTEYFKHAEISLGAYANLGIVEIDEQKLASAEFVAIQAQYFSSTYEIVDFYTDSNGLSVTDFGRRDGTGERCLAIRGTNDLDDLLTDLVDIVLLGTTALQSQYASLKAQVTAWINDGTLASTSSPNPRSTRTAFSC
jgi:hypothetical protein